MSSKVKIDMKSIMSKINSYIGSGEFTKDAAVSTKAQMDKLANAAGQALVTCYHNAAMSSSLTDGALSAVMSAGDPTYSVEDLGNGEYHISVDIPYEGRKSLYPQGYPGGAPDIVALMNHGYSASGQVYGAWEGHSPYAVSLQYRDGAYFVQSAVEDFKGNYGAEYGVVDATCDEGRFG